MSSTYGRMIKLSIFGQSHGPAIGMTLDGVPAGLFVDTDKLQDFLNRRAPGQHSWSTARKEEDRPEFLSGLYEGSTCGAPISAILRNKDVHPETYAAFGDCPRPGHADYTAAVKYQNYQDPQGGGHFSGRLTAPLCIAGGLCKQWLERENIHIFSHISSIAGISDQPFDPLHPGESNYALDFPTISSAAGASMKEAIARAKEAGDSVGGTVECAVTGLPVGLGEPMFGGMESRIAQIIYGIPAVKGLEFGTGFASAAFRGSENNDAFVQEGGNVQTLTNNCGGILGGISNGMPLLFQVAIKPTPSIGKTQQTVSLSTMQNTTLQIQGRHDPCIVPRAVPVIEAAAAIAIYDAYLEWKARK